LERPVSVAIVEDHDVVVEGVRSWVAADAERRATIVSVTGSVDDLLAGPGRDADVVVLDLELDQEKVSQRIAVQRVARLCDAGMRVVVFSVHVQPLIIKAVIEAGACAFLDKGAEQDDFVDTVVAVAQDRPVVTPSMAGGLLETPHLSPREQEALLHRFQGMDYPSIARRMQKPTGAPISASTVKQYIERARAKFAAAGRSCRSNFSLLARCIEDGLIRPEDVEDYRSTASAPTQNQ
jgi:DNA-binding NarL/FixJ family response regulator